MKLSLKKIALSLLLAFWAIVLCVFGSNFFRSEGNKVAVAADKPTVITVVSSASTMQPSDTITITVTATTTIPGDWASLALNIAPLSEEGAKLTGEAALCQYFEMVDFEFGPDFSDDKYAYISNDKFASNDGAYVGFGPMEGAELVPSTTPLTVTVTIKLKDDAPQSIGGVKFGIAPLPANYIGVDNAGTIVKHCANGKAYNGKKLDSTVTDCMEIKLASVFVGTADANLKTVLVGHGSATNSVTVADDMVYNDNGTGNNSRTDFKISATPSDSTSTIKYSVGATSTPSTAVANGSAFNVTLDTSGVTVVRFLVTASGGAATKNYTLTIKSSYARINTMTVAVQRPSDAGTVSGLGYFSPASFNKDTFIYTVKTTSDATSVDFTPTVVADFGINASIAVSTTGCTADATVTSSNKLSVTGITNGATLKLTVTAADGKTTQDYTITFNVFNTDTSISSLSMTEDLTGNSVSNDATKATAAGMDYYFLLSGESGFKGKFNLTLGESTSNAKITANGSTSNFNANTVYNADDYTITVQAAAGNTKVYKVRVAKDIKKGEITDLQYALGSGAYTALVAESSSDSGTTTTYVYNLKLNLDDCAVNTQFNIKGTITAGSTVTKQPSTLTGTSGTVTNTAGSWNKALTYGKNEYTLEASTTEGKSIYKITVNLVEDKNAITAVSITNSKSASIPSDLFSFNETTTSYNITVPYADYDKINFTFTTNGKYTSVYREGTTNTKLARTQSTTTATHTLSNQSLTSGDTVTFSFHAQADDTLGDEGDTYTFTFTRELADTDATLTDLTVTIGGEVKDFKDATFNPNITAYTIEIERPDSNPASSPVVITATTKSSTSSLKIAENNGTAVAMTNGTANKTFTYQTGEHSTDYKITVTSQDNSTTTYVVTVKKIVPDPKFTDLKVSYINNSNPESVLESGDYNSETRTYTVTKNIADVPVNSSIYLSGTTTKEATVSKSSNLTGNSSPWSGSLAHGENTFTLTVNATGKTPVVYTIVVKLLENKRDIVDVTITFNGQNVDGNFKFDQGTSTYNLTVPYAMTVPTKTDPEPITSVVITVTANGFYTVIQDVVHNQFDTNDSIKTSTISIALTAGRTTTIGFGAIADKDITKLPTSLGSLYTFNIERAAADTDATLSSLDVTVDGTPITFVEGLFDPDNRTYNYTIPSTGNATAALVFTAVAKSDKAKLKFAVNSATATAMTNGVSNQTFTFRDANYTETYKIVVIPESGEKDKVEYQVLIKRVLQKGDFEEIRIATDNISFGTPLKDAYVNEFDANGTYTISYNISEVPVGSKIYFEAKATADSTVSVTNLTKNGDKYEATLTKFGATTVKFTATSKSGKTDYIITINLIEDNDDISNIVIAGVEESKFTFNQFTTSYDIEVPFTVSNVTLTVTPDGTYGVVKKQGTTTDAVLTKNGSNYEEKVSLRAGEITTLIIYGVANEGRGKSDDATAKGTAYTFNFKREQANSDTTLADLVVKIDGKTMPIDFDPGLNEYVIEIEKPDGQSSSTIDISATPSNSESKVTGKTGPNTFSYFDNREHETDYVITVTAQDGKKMDYTVKVKRIIVAGDFETLEFAESVSSRYEDVKLSSKFNPLEYEYTVDFDLAKIAVGSKVCIKAVPTSGAQVITTGEIKESAQKDIYLATLAAGENVFTLSAKTATGEKTYTFVVNLYEGKNKVEKVDISVDGAPLASDVYKFVAGQTSYDVTVPYTVNTIKFNVTVDGDHTVVLDDDDNAFEKLTSGNGKHHERTVQLQEGRATTVMFRAKSDKGEEGEWYEYRIVREAANSDASLKSLVVTVGGRPMAFTEGEFDPDRSNYSIQVDEQPSYNVNITAVPNASTTKVSGDGAKTFNLSDSAATQSFPVVTTAEDGSTRTYNVTISQKPIIRSSNYDIRRIVINGTRAYYDDVPASYNSGDPIQITVPYTQDKVNVVVTTTEKATAVTEPTLSANGYIDLPEGGTVKLIVYAVAEDGTNAFGADRYEFEITREVANTDATLSSLEIRIGGRLMAFNEGSFDPSRTDYTIQVDESPSYGISIAAQPTVESSTVSGTGSFTFKLDEANGSSANYSVVVTAEDGSTRTYNVWISQKPYVPEESYEIRKISITGRKDYFDGTPDSYNSEDDPIGITVSASDSKVKVNINTVSQKATVKTSPELKNGYLELPEDSTTTFMVYAIAENGANAGGEYKYVFEITREKQNEVSGPDAVVTLRNANSIERTYEVDIDSEETLVYVVGTYSHRIDMVDVTVKILYGDSYDYEIFRVDSANFTSVAKGYSGDSRKVKLDYGTNVFSINMRSPYSQKAVIFVFERERAALRSLSSSAIASLREDFDPNRDNYTYNVSSNIDYLGLTVDIDTNLYEYDYKGSEHLEYGANQILIEIYELTDGAQGRAAVREPVRTITINVTRERSNLFWFIMFWVLIALVIAELIIILLVRRNKNNGGHDEPTIIMTAPPAPQALPQPQQPQIQPIIIQAPPPQQVQMPQQQPQLPQPGQTTFYINPNDPNNPQY